MQGNRVYPYGSQETTELRTILAPTLVGRATERVTTNQGVPLLNQVQKEERVPAAAAKDVPLLDLVAKLLNPPKGGSRVSLEERIIRPTGILG